MKKLFKKLKKISTTKVLVFFLFMNCTLLELFTAWVTTENLILARDFGTALDFTPLVTLIGIVLGEVFGFAVYAAKSAKENSSGGLVYESTMKELEFNYNIQNEESVG